MQPVSIITSTKRICLCTVCILLLCACQTPPNRQVELTDHALTSDLDKYRQRRDLLESIQAWHIQGKVGLTDQRRNQSQSGQINWQQTQDFFTLRIANPLGQEAINIKGQNQQVTAQVGDKQYHATSVSNLIEQEFDWHWPESQVKLWLLGIIDSDHKGSFRLNEKGQLVFIEQGEWQISYRNYQAVIGTHAETIWLPKKITLKKDGFTIRLIINQWDIHTSLG